MGMPSDRPAAMIAGTTIIAVPLVRVLLSGWSMMTATLHREIRPAYCRKNASLLVKKVRSNLGTISRLIQPSENTDYRQA